MKVNVQEDGTIKLTGSDFVIMISKDGLEVDSKRPLYLKGASMAKLNGIPTRELNPMLLSLSLDLQD